MICVVGPDPPPIAQNRIEELRGRRPLPRDPYPTCSKFEVLILKRDFQRGAGALRVLKRV